MTPPPKEPDLIDSPTNRDWQRLWPWPALVAYTVVATDQWTKWMAMAHQASLEISPVTVIPGFFNLVYVKNTGAAWGMMAGQMGFLALLSLAVFLLIVICYRRFTGGWPERGLAISLVLGGVVGNLIDRLFYEGVIDFLGFYVGSFHWPAFNVADSAICIGVGIFLISSFLRPEETVCGSPEAPAKDA